MISTKHKYGWHPSIPDHRDHIYSAPHEHMLNLPSSVDLTSNMPEVYDQGDLGSCTANAVAAAVEYERMKQSFEKTMPSRLFIYYHERALEGTINSDSGAQIRDGIKTIATKGVCPEEEWPYDISKFTVCPSPQCYADALKELATIYSAVPQDLTQLKSVLAEGYPIAFGIAIFESFESEEVANTGIVPMPNFNESCLGGHAVLIVGFDDASQSFKVRNSWGTGWGIPDSETGIGTGYFTLPYSYVLNAGLASDFWVIKLIKS